MVEVMKSSAAADAVVILKLVVRVFPIESRLRARANSTVGATKPVAVSEA